MWVRREPIALNFDYRNTFSFYATIRREIPPPEPAAPNPGIERAAAKPSPDNSQARRSPKSETAEPPQTLHLPNAQSLDVPREPAAVEPGRHIDLEQARRIAREYGSTPLDPRFNTVGTNNGLEGDTDSARAIAKAARGDCKSAYAGIGLLAIPALLWDTVRDKGCKW
jgi:hypothetical protein